MTSNEQHLLMCDSTIKECESLAEQLKRVRTIIKRTEPPRRDSSGPEVAHLSLRTYKATMQAKESVAMLEQILIRTRKI